MEGSQRTMLTIGIDIGGRQHVAARCRDGQPRADHAVLRFGADRAGFDALDAWLAAQPAPVGLVAMESSGHSWMPLASHLRRAGLAVAVVNPLSAKYFAKRHLRRTKSDPADARVLAELAMRDDPRSGEPLAGAELRAAARFAMGLVRQRASVCQRLQRLVELGFPELREIFDDPSCRTAREVLRLAPTAAAATRRRTSTLAAANAGPRRRALGAARAAALQAAAQHTTAPPELEAEVAFEVPVLLDQLELLDRQMAVAEAHLAGLLDGALARRLQTIPGVGPASAAAFLAEIGDIGRFEDFDQLLAFAGMHPREASSGRKGASPETSWQMAKTGNPHLRAAAYHVALAGIVHNPLIRAHYLRKREAGKSPMNALGHCMRKALAIVWGVWRSGRDFDPAGGRPH